MKYKNYQVPVKNTRLNIKIDFLKIFEMEKTPDKQIKQITIYQRTMNHQTANDILGEKGFKLRAGYQEQGVDWMLALMGMEPHGNIPR